MISFYSKLWLLQVVYQEVGTFSGDSRTSLTTSNFASTELYPGRNYSVSVFAVSNGMESEPTIRHLLTRKYSNLNFNVEIINNI